MVVATGRGDWIGGLEFKRESFSFAAQVSTAEVIKAVSADVFCLVEVENRSCLEEFARAHLKPAGFSCNMLIDGNDSRGIDLGLLSRFIVSDLRSHIHDRDPARPSSRIFSRDCLEARVEIPGSKPLWVLLNHFKSKGYGPPCVRVVVASADRPS